MRFRRPLTLNWLAWVVGQANTGKTERVEGGVGQPQCFRDPTRQDSEMFHIPQSFFIFQTVSDAFEHHMS